MHHVDRELQAFSNLRVGQAFELGQQKHLAHPAAQAVQHLAHGVQRLEYQQSGFRRGLVLRFQLREGLQVRALQGLAAEILPAQAAGHGVQVGPGFAQYRQLLAAQDAHKGVLRQVHGLVLVAELASQQLHHPVVMLEVELAHGVL